MHRMLMEIGRRSQLVAISVLGIALGFSLACNIHRTPAVTAAQQVTNKTAVSGDFRNVFADVAEKVMPSVVSVTSESSVEARPQSGDSEDPFGFPFPFGGPGPRHGGPREPRVGTGSGMIVRPDGYILTNNHVVEGADRVTVRLQDGREFKGKVSRDPRTDLAIIKIEAKDLQAVSFADSNKLRPGDWAMAIGGPFGLRSTVTVGVVSAVRRESDSSPNAPRMSEMVQTDAAINPGNSGGPLLDIDGKVIGVNRMIISPSGTNAGIGFAVPSNTAEFVMKRLIEKGKVVRGFLGIEPLDVSSGMAKQYGVSKGAVVNSLGSDSPAKAAGLQVQDVITKVGDTVVESANELRHAVEIMDPDEVVKLTIIRDKQEKVLSVKLGTAPTGLEKETPPENGAKSKLGITIQPLDKDTAEQLGIPTDVKGVLVRGVDSGGPAQRAGMKPGDVIVELNNTPIPSIAELHKAAGKLKSGDAALVVVQRGDGTTILEVDTD